MPKVSHVKARKDYTDAGIKKGEMYYTWKFNFGPVVRSKTAPKPQDLTRSEFIKSYLDIKENLSTALQGAQSEDDLQNAISDTVDTINELQSTCQDTLDNIPQQLQGGNAGTILQERIDALNEWMSNLESIDTTMEDDEEEPIQNEGESDNDFKERHETWEKVVQENRDNKLEEIRSEIEESDPGVG